MAEPSIYKYLDRIDRDNGPRTQLRIESERECGFLATRRDRAGRWRETHARGRKLATNGRRRDRWGETHAAPPSMRQLTFAGPPRPTLPKLCQGCASLGDHA